MNETNTQQPELLAAILAEMRDFCSGWPEDLDVTVKVGLIYGWACRLKAAAERERAITDIMLAVKDKPLPHPDPDNAPPLFFPMTKTQLQTLSDLVAIAHDEMDGLPYHEQELERFDSLLFDMKARYAFDKPYTAPPEHPSNAALAAPARNCDRFATAKDALDEFIREKEIKTEDVDALNLRDFFDWLFAPAEGGNHA